MKDVGNPVRRIKMSILVWIIYDISDDKARGKIARECKKS